MRTWDLIYAACDRRQTYPPSAAAGARSTGLAAAFAHEVKEGTPIHTHLTFEPAGDGTRMRFRAHGRLRGRAPRVLLVDDQPDFRHVVRLLLERRGYVVVAEAGCAATALDAVERFAPDAVLLDIRLGCDDGFDVCRRLIGRFWPRAEP